MKRSRIKFKRRDFLKQVGLATPLIFGGASGLASPLQSPKGREIFGTGGTSRSRENAGIIKPERLRFGDKVGLVAPASPPTNPEAVNRDLAALARLGFKPELAPNARKRLGYLAGTDAERADDLMTMFADDEVKAIFCIRGGYGSGRLLPLLDYRFIQSHPKILIGFSDITSLFCAFLTQAGLVSFHAPTLNTNLTSENPSPFTEHSLLRTVMEPSAAGSICEGYTQNTVSVLSGGIATGRLIGGNLSVFCSVMGTPFEPDFRNRILFFEDVDEEPYRFDRRLTQLSNAGALQQVAGVAVGINPRCTDPEASRTAGYRQNLADVLKDRLGSLGVPVVTGLPFGHVRWNATLPVGALARLDGNNGDLVLIEAAVK